MSRRRDGLPTPGQLLLKLNPTGRILEVAAFPHVEDGREQAGDLNWFHGVSLDRCGNGYAGDSIGRRVQKIIRA